MGEPPRRHRRQHPCGITKAKKRSTEVSAFNAAGHYPALVGGVGKGLPTYVLAHPHPPPPGNYAAHKHPEGIAWLAKHPRFHMYFTPTSSSWLNLVERIFRDLTDRISEG